CRRGAAVKNLSHSASFHPKDKIAPSNAGTKHLELRFRSSHDIAATSDANFGIKGASNLLI
ncbi:MAG: hypothetical protein WBE54_25770, partial [Bradyrhizobium sp.]